MIRLNLLPDVKLEFLRTRRTHARVMGVATIVTIAALAITVLLAFWVFGVQTAQKKLTTDAIVKNEKTLRAIPDLDKYLTVQNQMTHITKLHDQKSDLSRLLGYLRTLNPAPPHNVILTNIELVNDGETGSTLILNGEAKDYTGLSTFRDTLANAQLKAQDVDEKLFTSVTVTSSGLQQSTNGGEVVVFQIDTSYSPNAFLFTVKNPTVSVPVKTTTQSAEAAPDIFGKSTVEEEQ